MLLGVDYSWKKAVLKSIRSLGFHTACCSYLVAATIHVHYIQHKENPRLIRNPRKLSFSLGDKGNTVCKVWLLVASKAINIGSRSTCANNWLK